MQMSETSMKIFQPIDEDRLETWRKWSSSWRRALLEE